MPWQGSAVVSMWRDLSKSGGITLELHGNYVSFQSYVQMTETDKLKCIGSSWVDFCEGTFADMLPGRHNSYGPQRLFDE